MAVRMINKGALMMTTWLWLWLLLVVGPAYSHSDCNREMSRRVRGLLHDRLLKVLNIAAENLPTSCPLHPGSDLFWDQEQHKTKTTNDQWKCEYCAKLFRSEHYLDKHMGFKHPETVNKDGQCLADLCPIFGCQAMYNGENADAIRAKFDSTVSCVEDDAEAYRFKCETIATKCFTGNTNADEVFRSQICSAIRCDRGLLQGPRIGMNHANETNSAWTGLRKTMAIIVLFATLGTAVYAWAHRSKPGQRSVLRTKGQQDGIVERSLDFVSATIGIRSSSKKHY